LSDDTVHLEEAKQAARRDNLSVTTTMEAETSLDRS
jgi:hypothetical protein